MQTLSASLRKENKTIGFVPTMGYLHEGHLSLMREALSRSDYTVASIFVNPFQFGPGEDFKHYPRDLKGDILKCQKAGLHCVFLPRKEEIMEAGERSYVVIEKLMERLCGASRPGHFQGVATIVLKLLNIVRPRLLFLGAKDFQQTVILKKMSKDFFIPIEVVVLPTIRETDGLAMSSRNSYLSESDRKSATVLFRAMRKAAEQYQQGEKRASQLKSLMLEEIGTVREAKVDYLEIVDPEHLTPVDEVHPEAVAALAVWIGKTRLIDNMVFPAIKSEMIKKLK